MSIYNFLEAFFDASFADRPAQTPISWPLGGNNFLCRNYTGSYQDIGFGMCSRRCLFVLSHPAFHAGFYVPDHQDPVTALVVPKNPYDNSFHLVGLFGPNLYLVVFSGGSIIMNFTPILSACIVTGSWQNGKVVEGQIEGRLDWNLDLTSPPKHTNWILEESGAGYTLEIDDLARSPEVSGSDG